MLIRYLFCIATWQDSMKRCRNVGIRFSSHHLNMIYPVPKRVQRGGNGHLPPFKLPQGGGQKMCRVQNFSSRFARKVMLNKIFPLISAKIDFKHSQGGKKRFSARFARIIINFASLWVNLSSRACLTGKERQY